MRGLGLKVTYRAKGKFETAILTVTCARGLGSFWGTSSIFCIFPRKNLEALPIDIILSGLLSAKRENPHDTALKYSLSAQKLHALFPLKSISYN
jgi:hypothetical protein